MDYTGSDSETRSQHIYGRRFQLCKSLLNYDYEDLILTCTQCGIFCAACCGCPYKYDGSEEPCHHWPIVFTDGACSNNGRIGACAGVGIAFGATKGQQYSVPVSDIAIAASDTTRTNQRAELLAVWVALQRTRVDACSTVKHVANGRKELSRADGVECLIIATDSEYAVKGMTEWLPKWKVT